MPDNEKKVSTYVKLLTEILQMLQLFTEWKVLCPAAFLTFAILVLYKILTPYIILGTMFDTIRDILIFLLMLSLAGIGYKLTAKVVLYVKGKVEKYLLKRYNERIEQGKERAEIFEVGEIVKKLPNKELSILKYMHSKGGVTWLPVSDSAVLNLHDTNCIYSTLNFSMLRGELYGERSQCFAYKITPKVERNISRLSSDIQERLENVQTASWLSLYEQALE